MDGHTRYRTVLLIVPAAFGAIAIVVWCGVSFLTAWWPTCTSFGQAVAAAPLLALAAAASALLAAGAVVQTGKLLAAARRERMALTVLAGSAQHVRHAFGAGVTLLDTALPLAITQGLRRPHTWLSTGLTRLLPRAALSAVLAHEAWHRMRRDPLRSACWRAAAALLWFLPVLRTAARHALTTMEHAADCAALRRGSTRSDILTALTALLATPSAAPAATVSFAVHASVSERIRLLAGTTSPPSPRGPTLLSFAMLFLLALPVLATAHQAQPPRYAARDACVAAEAPPQLIPRSSSHFRMQRAPISPLRTASTP